MISKLRISNDKDLAHAANQFICNIVILMQLDATIDDIELTINEACELMVSATLSSELISAYEEKSEPIFDIENLYIVARTICTDVADHLDVFSRVYDDEVKVSNWLIKNIMLTLTHQDDRYTHNNNSIDDQPNSNQNGANIIINCMSVLQKIYIKLLSTNASIYSTEIKQLKDKNKAIDFKNRQLKYKVHRVHRLVGYKEQLKAAIKKDYDEALEYIENVSAEKNRIETSKILHTNSEERYKLTLVAYEEVNKHLMGLFLEAQNNYIKVLNEITRMQTEKALTLTRTPAQQPISDEPYDFRTFNGFKKSCDNLKPVSKKLMAKSRLQLTTSNIIVNDGEDNINILRAAIFSTRSFSDITTSTQNSTCPKL